MEAMIMDIDGLWISIMHHACLYFCVPPGAIKRKVELDWGTEDSEYLQKVELHSEGALNEVRPDIIVYNAGTDILDGDPLGGLSISPQVLHLLCQTLHLNVSKKWVEFQSISGELQGNLGNWGCLHICTSSCGPICRLCHSLLLMMMPIMFCVVWCWLIIVQLRTNHLTPVHVHPES